MRLISGALTVIAVAGFGFASGSLVLAFFPEPQDVFVEPERAAPQEIAVILPDNIPTAWPAVFGVVPEVLPEPEPEPEPEAVEEPPQENTTYWLTGLVAGQGNGGWAMISENDRSVVVRVGDELIGGEIVTAINAQGVWIERDGVKELIALQKSDLTALVTRGETVVEGSTDLASEITIVVESLDQAYLSSIVEEAGRMGANNEVAAITPGQLFDAARMRVGDKIASVNGKPLQSGDLLADIDAADLAAGALELEVERGAARQIVKVIFDEG